MRHACGDSERETWGSEEGSGGESGNGEIGKLLGKLDKHCLVTQSQTHPYLIYSISILQIRPNDTSIRVLLAN